MLGFLGIVEVAVPDLLPSEDRDGRRRRFRSRGMLVRQSVNSSLVSVAGLIRAPVRDLESHDVGRLVDVVVRWDRGVYPQVSGLVMRIGSRRAFVHVADVSNIGRPVFVKVDEACLLYTSPSPRDRQKSRMPSS